MNETKLETGADSSRSAPLFRPEVFEHRQQTAGAVLLSPPAILRWFALIVGLAFLALFAFILTVSLPRVETVRGHLDGSKGVVTVVGADSGVIVDVGARPGWSVRAGDKLFEIERPGAGDAVAGAAETARRHLQQQRRIAVQAEMRYRKLAEDDLALLEVRADTLKQRQAMLLEQRRMAAARASTMTDRLARIEGLKEQGLVTGVEREQALLDHQDAASAALALDREIAETTASIGVLRHEAERRRSEIEVEALSRSRERLELDSRLNALRNKEIIVARAPVDGLVTAVNAKPGQHVAAGAEVVRLLPESSRLLARFTVPSAVIGLVEAGQTVRLRYDAFPFEKYGDQQGRITAVSTTAVSENGASSADGAVERPFMINVSLEQDHILAAGEPRRLLPEMAVTGAIVLERRTIGEWLLEPLFALRGRV